MSTHKKGKAFNRRDQAFKKKKKKKSGPLNKDWKILKCKQGRAPASAKKPNEFEHNLDPTTTLF